MTKAEACPEGPGDAFRLFAAVNPAIWLPVHSDVERILSRRDPTGRGIAVGGPAIQGISGKEAVLPVGSSYT